ncbi:hypothetical protein ACS0TY_010452 [Phlomoides rotata]
MWIFKRNWASGFSSSSTAEEVTNGIDASALTAIVTGATSGIGLETARVLALRGVHVIMGVLIMAEGLDVKDKIVQEIPSAKLHVMELDLSSMESVQNFASHFLSSGLPLNILINNAGIFMPPFTLSRDGIELQFATNYLGHFLLTNLVLERMKKTAGEMKWEGRIVNVSSVGQRLCYRQGIRFDRLNDPQGYNGLLGYGQSKLALILHAKELARRLKEDGANVTANSLHPGLVATNIVHVPAKIKGFINILFYKFFLKTVQQGASTSCYLALHPQVKGISGEYFADNNLAKPNAQAADATLASKLWDFSLHLTNKY